MSSQNFGYYEEIFFPEDENEWLDSSVFSDAKDLWLKSNGLRGDSNYSKACNLLNPYFSVSVDKERMIGHFAKKVAQQDEDGWTNISDEDQAYGLRKSIFENFDLDEYWSEEADSDAVIGIDFRERDEDDVPIEDSFMDSPYITVIATKAFDLKKKIDSQEELEKWEEKNEFELQECFSLDISSELTSYIDEDGDETSGYSSEGGYEGVVVFEKNDTVDRFSERLQAYALGSTSIESEPVEISSEAKEIFKAIYSGDIENLKEIIPDQFDINMSLGPPGITAPLPLAFCSIFFGETEVMSTLKEAFDANSVSFQEKGSIEEVVYFLASKGADLNYQINPGTSYLGIAVSFSKELSDFLISFGMDVTGDAADAILTAASNGKLDYVNQFLEAGTDPNFTFSGTSALMYAAQGIDEESTLSLNDQKIQINIIDALLDKKADINLVDEGGDTALTNAIRSKNHEIVKHLLDKGSSPNIVGESMAPLQLASDIKDEVSINLLSEKGAVIEKKPSKKKAASPKKVSPKKESKKIKEKQEESKVPSGKVACPSCDKYFTQKTIDKWGGTCGTCYRKENPHSTSSNQSSYSESSGCWDTLDNIGSSIDDCFEVIKMLAIMGFVIYIFIAIIIAMFS